MKTFTVVLSLMFTIFAFNAFANTGICQVWNITGSHGCTGQFTVESGTDKDKTGTGSWTCPDSNSSFPIEIIFSNASNIVGTKLVTMRTPGSESNSCVYIGRVDAKNQVSGTYYCNSQTTTEVYPWKAYITPC